MILASNLVTDSLRTLFAFLCEAIYVVIAFAYNLFFEIASFKILNSDGIKEIYQRVTFILAIVMFFYMTFEFVKYVVQPDAMTDKEKGVQKMGFRMIGVILLIVFVPTVFSLAYDLQHTLISKGTISQIFLGKTLSDPLYSGRQFSAQVLDEFYSYDGPESNECGDGVQCDGIVKLNKATLINEGKLPYMTMGINGKPSATQDVSGVKVKDYYIHFDGLFAVGVGAFLAWMLILYCVDVAVRSIQLLYLQIIAPIPIIGFLTPKKDNIFGKWVKQCITTYLDIFIRISLIYFIFLVCRTLLDSDAFSHLDEVGGLVKIALIMGLLLFAQKAPKMLQELFPKMGAASGNFGLKAGERVAPVAARAIGGSLGFARGLVGGAIRRNRWRAARNKANGWSTGLSRLTKAGRANNRRKRNEIAQHKADAYSARLEQKNLQKQNKQKEKFDSARNAWNRKQAQDSELQRLKTQAKAAKDSGRTALANSYGQAIADRLEFLRGSSEYKKWDAARKEMQNSKTIKEMQSKNLQNKRDLATAGANVNAADRDRTAALNRQNELLRWRDVTKGRLTAAQQELDNARRSGDATRITAAEVNVAAAQRAYDVADKNAREVFAGRDEAAQRRANASIELNEARAALANVDPTDAVEMAKAEKRVADAERAYNAADAELNSIVNGTASAFNDRNSAIIELNSAQEALEAAQESNDPEAIAAAQERVRLAEEKYNLANDKVTLFDKRDAAIRERDAAYQELEAADASGREDLIEAANRRVEAAERGYEEANGGLSQKNSQYQAAQRKYDTAQSEYNERQKEIDTYRKEQGIKSKDLFTKSAESQYGEKLQEAANRVDRTHEQVIKDQNEHFQGFAGSAASTVGGAFRVGAAGFKAKKLEEVHKQVEQGVKNDIANVKAVQKYYDDGGTGWVDRTVQQVEKKVGMPTDYERTMLGIHSYDSKIKTYGSQAELAKSYSSAADSTENRFRDKAKDSDLKVDVGTRIKTGLKDANGNNIYADVGVNESTGSVVRRYKQRAVEAHAAQEAATKRRDDYKAENAVLLSRYESMSDAERENMTDDEKKIVAQAQTYEEVARKASEDENNANYAAENVEKNAGRYLAVKVMAAIAKNPTPQNKEKLKEKYDGAGVENAWNLYERMKIIKQNPDMVAEMEKLLRSMGKGEYFDVFMSGQFDDSDNVEAWNLFDTLNNASKTITSDYERLKSDLSEKQRNVQTSNETSSQKAAQDYNGGGSGK